MLNCGKLINFLINGKLRSIMTTLCALSNAALKGVPASVLFHVDY